MTAPTEPSPRIDALDTARGFAVLVMIYMHLVPEDAMPFLPGIAHLAGLGDFLAGKGAVLFLLLAGFVWNEQARRTPLTPRFSGYVVRRSLALFAFGWLLAATVWPTEILRTIACLFLVMSVLVRLPSPFLIVAWMLTLFAAPVLAIECADQHAADWLEDGRHVFEIEGTFGATLRTLFLTGNYPLVTWIAFPLAGACLARFLNVGQPVADKLSRLANTYPAAANRHGFQDTESFSHSTEAGSNSRTCVNETGQVVRDWLSHMARLAFLTLLPIYVAAETFACWATDREELLGYWASLFQSTWTPTSPTFVLVTTAFGTMLVSSLLAFPTRALAWILAPIGRASLTHYVLHVLIVFVPLRVRFPAEDWSADVGLLAFGAYALFAGIASHLWFARFRRGPLEALLAWFAGGAR